MVTAETERNKKMEELRSLLDKANALFVELTGEGIEVKKSEETLDKKVSNLLHEIGIPANIKGYLYAKIAIIICIEEPITSKSLTKDVYPTIASEFGTTSSAVERGIRHAIERAWEMGNTELLNNIFGWSVNPEKGKPVNSEFIAMIAEYVKD